MNSFEEKLNNGIEKRAREFEQKLRSIYILYVYIDNKTANRHVPEERSLNLN